MMETAQILSKYKEHLLKKGFSPATIERKLSSIRAYLSFITSLKPSNPQITDKEVIKKLKEFGVEVKEPQPSFVSQLLFVRAAKKLGQVVKEAPNWRYTIPYSIKYKRPKWFVTYQKSVVSKYITVSLVVILCVALGIGCYEKFGTKFLASKKGEILGLPTSSPSYLSFQARLTDNFDNPITVSTHFRFALYSDPTASDSAKLWEEAKWIKPDNDGILNTLIGDTVALDKSIFRDNTDLYLGVTVNDNAEMLDRQRVATVAYAFNSEYLQGYGIGTSGAADTNQVLVVNSEGNVIIAAASPSLQSTSGTFTIDAKTLYLTTADNGSINLDPGGTGGINLTSQAASGNAINATSSALTTGNLFYGGVYNNNTGFNLMNLVSGTGPTESTKFMVDASGNAYFAGSLGIGVSSSIYNLEVGGTSSFNDIKVNGALFDSGNSPGANGFVLGSTGTGVSWSNLSDISVGNADTLDDLDSTDFLRATASDTFESGNTLTIAGILSTTGNAFFGNYSGILSSSGNVGIGTTSPTSGYKLDIEGNLRVGGSASIASTVNLSSLTASRPLKLDADKNIVSTQIDLGSANDITGILAAAYGGTGINGGTAPNGTLLIGNGSGYSLSTLTAGTGIGITNSSGGITLHHGDTSSVADSNNSDGVVIQSLTFDGMGHVQTRSTVDLDSRYLQSAGVSWILAGDSGTPQEIGIGNTASVLGGAGLSSSASSTDTLTLTVGEGIGVSVGPNDISVNEGYAFSWSGNQTWSGTASFNNNVYFPGSGIWNTSGNVGIGTTSPTSGYKLDVEGNLRVGGSASIASTVNLSLLTASRPLKLDANKNIVSTQIDLASANDITGILAAAYGGTGINGGTAPNGTLLIGNGSGYTLATLTQGTGIGITNSSGSITLHHADTSTQGSLNNSDGTVIQDITLDDMGHITGLGTVDLDLRYLQSADVSWVLKGDSGTPEAVGIGNTVFIAGGAGLSSSASATDTLTLTVGAGVGISVGPNDVSVNEGYAFNWSGNQTWSGTASFNNTATFTGNVYLPSGIWGSSGNVGIGTTDISTYELNIGGQVQATGFCIDGDCKTDWASIGIGGSGTQNYIPKWTGGTTLGISSIWDDGNVGIGTTSPTSGYKLDIEGNLRVGGSALITSNVNLSALTASRPLKLDANKNIISSQIDLASSNDITGILGAAYGGTGINGGTAPNGTLLIGNGSGYTLANLTQGTGIGITNSSGGITLHHGDTSSVADSNNSDGVVIQSLTFDGMGHVQTRSTVDLDSRYLQSAGVSWMLKGDSGTPESIGIGNTAFISGGAGLASTVSATDTLTLAIGAGIGISVGPNDVSVNEGYAFSWSGNQTWSGTAGFNNTATFAGNTYFPGSGIWNTSGNVGIGTTTPASGYKLDINGNLRVGSSAYFGSTVNLNALTASRPLKLDAGKNIISSQIDLASTNDITGILGASYGGTGINGGTAPNGTLLIGNGSGYSLSTLTAGTGIGITNSSGGITLHHGDTSSVADSNNSDGVVIQSLTFDGMGHVQTRSTVDLDARYLQSAGVSWILAGDSGTPQTINIGNTASILGGAGLSSSASSTDTLTLTVGEGIGVSVGPNDVSVNEGYAFSWSGNQSWSGTATFTNNVYFPGSGIWNSSGNVGIGTTSPTSGYKLDIEGNLRVGGSASIASTVNLSSLTASRPLKLDADKNIVSTQIDLASSNDVTGILAAAYGGTGINGGTAPNGTLLIGNGSGYSLSTLTAGTGIGITNSSGSITIHSLYTGTVTGTGLDNYIPRWNGTTDLENSIIYDDNSNIGIGTTNPTAKLDVNGNLRIGGTAFFADVNAGLRYESGTGKMQFSHDGSDWYDLGTGTGGDSLWEENGSLTYLSSLTSNLGIGGSTSATSPFFFETAQSSLYLGIAGSSNGLLSFRSSGIGESAPTISADASGNLNIEASTGAVNVGSGDGNIELSLTQAADYVVTSKVTTISSAYSGDDFSFTRTLTGNYTQGGSVVLITDTSSSNTTMNADMLKINAAPSSGTFTGNLLRLQVGGDDKMVVTAGGNVGIGTTSPTSGYKLDIEGNLRVGGSALITSNVNLSLLTASRPLKLDANKNIVSTQIDLASSNDVTGILAAAYGGTGINGGTAPNGTLLIGNGSGYSLSTLTAGTGIGITNSSGGITLHHGDTSSVADSNNSDGVVIQSLTFDGMGHVQTRSTVDLDSRYLQSAGVSWMLKGDSGTPESIGIGNTAFISGGAGLASTVSATDTLTLAIGAGIGISVGPNDVSVNEGYAFSWSGNQSWSGTATFTNNVYFPGSGIWNTSGNVGIGTTSPTSGYKLDIEGNLRVGGSASIASTVNLSSLTASRPLKLDANKNIISSQIDLASTNDITGILGASYGGTGINGGTAPNGTLLIGNGSGYSLSTLTAGTGIGITNGAGTITIHASSLGVGGSGTQNYIPKWNTSTSLTNSVIFDNGSVGIGTTNPEYSLDVNGQAAVRQELYSAHIYPHEDYSYNLGTSNEAWGSIYTYALEHRSNQDLLINAGSQSIIIASTLNISNGGSDVNPDITTSNNQNLNIVPHGTGRIGIGTTNPTTGYLMDINGSTKISTLLNVGTGITAPVATLTTGAGDGKILRSGSGGTGVWSDLVAGTGIGITNVEGTITIYAAGGGGGDISGSGTQNYLPKWNTSTSLTNSLIYDDGANIGIGKTNPTYKLDINGNLRISGDLRLDNDQILNSGGVATVMFASSPSTDWNLLDAGAWQVDNTANVGQAAFAINQRMGGDIFTASASGIPKFVINNSGNVGIGTTEPLGKLHISLVDPLATSYASYITLNSSTGMDLYGTYNDVTQDTGDVTYGLYNNVNISGDYGDFYGVYNNIQGAAYDGYAVGYQNYIDLTGNESDARGIWNEVYASNTAYGIYNDAWVFGAGTAYNVYNYVDTRSDAATQTAYGVYNLLKTYSGASDVAYGTYTVDHLAGGSTGGTQYGLYIDLDDPNVKNYSIYIEDGSGINYFGSNVGIGTTSPEARLHVAGTSSSEEGFEGTFPPSGWTTGGNANWFKSIAQYHGGSYSAEGGDIADNQSTWIKTTVSTSGILKFWWKVSSELDYDFLRFYINGVEKTKISGDTAWAEISYGVASGDELEWNYTKDEYVSNGSDTGWIDDINITYYGMIIDSNVSVSGIAYFGGNVGIGTAAPGNKLEVAGRIYQSGLGYSTFVGYEAGKNDDLSNNYNSALGYQALYSNTTGHSNSAMGMYALYSNTTGYNNSAMGIYALSSNTTGYFNSAMGLSALSSNTTGYFNSAMGLSALSFNTTGYSNSAMGMYALSDNTTGSYNSAMGAHALDNTRPTSKEITAFANSATEPGVKTTVTSTAHGRSNGTVVRISGTTNYNGSWTISNVATNTFDITKVFVADDATGWWGIDSEGSYNTALGSQAGYYNVTGSGNVFLGYKAGYNETGSNKLYIANSSGTPLIYGDFSTGNVGIGTVSPGNYKLNVSGDQYVSGSLSISNRYKWNIFGGDSEATHKKVRITSIIQGATSYAGPSDAYLLHVTARNGNNDIYNYLYMITAQANYGTYTWGIHVDKIAGDDLTVTTIQSGSNSTPAIWDLTWSSSYNYYNSATVSIIGHGYRGDNLTFSLLDNPGDEWLHGDVIGADEEKELSYSPINPADGIPIEVTTLNGQIYDGDAVASAPIEGITMKATKAGAIFGKTLESTGHWNEQNCPVVESLEVIKWPSDDGTNSAKPCFKVPLSSFDSKIQDILNTKYQIPNDYIYVGKIMTSIDFSWYDPDAYLTSIGEIQFNNSTYNGLLTNANANSLASLPYELKDSAGRTITRIGAYKDIVAGGIKASFGEITNFVADTLLVRQAKVGETLIVGGINIKDKLNEIERAISSSQFVNPVPPESTEITADGAVFTKVNTDYISPLSGNDLVIDLSQSVTGDRLPATGSDGLPADSAGFGTLLVKGNAQFEGNVGIGQTLEAKDARLDQLTARQASFSGELYAESARIKKLRAEQIDLPAEAMLQALQAGGLEEYLTNIYKNISGAEDQVADTSEDLAVADLIDTTPSTSSGQSLTDLSESWEVTDPSNDIQIQSNVTIYGTTTLAQTIIAGPLTQDGTFLVDNGNSINVLGDTLYIQNHRMGGIDLLAGKVTIDIDGNAVFEGDLTVKGSLFANMVKPVDGQITFDLSPNLGTGETGLPSEALAKEGFGKILVKGTGGETVYTLDASGSARFAGDIESRRAQFSGDIAASSFKVTREVIAAEPDLSGTIEATSSAGIAAIPTGSQEVSIKSPYVNEKSLIYITPIGSTDNQVIYLARTNPEEKTFTAAVDRRSIRDILFSWWIVN